MERVSDLKDQQKNIVLEFILIKQLELNKTKENGTIVTWLVGDESGTVEFGIWNCPLNIGDVIRLDGGYVSMFQGNKRLFVSKSGWINRTGTFRKIFKVSECHIDIVKSITQDSHEL